MDIVTHCRVPRYLHNDLPLGNPLGRPDDKVAQRESILAALALVVAAKSPATSTSTLSWAEDDNWKSAYARVDDDNREELLAMGDENRRKRRQDKENGLRR